MADPINPAAAPVVTSTPTPIVQDMNAQREATVGRQPVAPGGDPAAAEVRARQEQQGRGKEGPRSNLIRNPAPIVDPDAPPPPDPKVDESNLSASTLAEMEAGRNSLKRGKPGTGQAGTGQPNRNLQPTNPVDVTKPQV